MELILFYKGGTSLMVCDVSFALNCGNVFVSFIQAPTYTLPNFCYTRYVSNLVKVKIFKYGLNKCKYL